MSRRLQLLLLQLWRPCFSPRVKCWRSRWCQLVSFLVIHFLGGRGLFEHLSCSQGVSCWLGVCECLFAVSGNYFAAPGGATPSSALSAWPKVGILECLPDRACSTSLSVFTRLILTLAWVSPVPMALFSMLYEGNFCSRKDPIQICPGFLGW